MNQSTPETENFTEALLENRAGYFERELSRIRDMEPGEPIPTDISDGSPVRSSLEETAIGQLEPAAPEAEAPGHQQPVAVRDESSDASTIPVRKS